MIGSEKYGGKKGKSAASRRQLRKRKNVQAVRDFFQNPINKRTALHQSNQKYSRDSGPGGSGFV